MRLLAYLNVIGLMVVGLVAVGCGGNSKGTAGSAGASGGAGTTGVAGKGGSAGTTSTGGSAGTTSTGGSAGTTSMGGSAGTAGSGGMGGGAGATGGAGAGGVAGTSGSGGAAGMTDAGSDADAWIANGCSTSASPGGALIADFERADGGLSATMIGGVISSGSFSSRPVATVENGSLHLKGPAISAFNDDVFAIAFSACVDARAYDGVSFSVTGSTFLCRGGFSIVDTAHAATAGIFMNASGPPDAQPFASDLGLMYSSADASAVKRVLRFPFAAGTDPTKLIGVQWTFRASGPGESCDVDLTIDDVMFTSGAGDGG